MHEALLSHKNRNNETKIFQQIKRGSAFTGSPFKSIKKAS
jgi:hypothetical protein